MIDQVAVCNQENHGTRAATYLIVPLAEKYLQSG